MKLFLVSLLFCTSIAAKSQQLPKSIFIEKYNFDTVKILDTPPQPNIRSSIHVGNTQKRGDNFLNSTDVFKNKELLASSNKYPNFNTPILDTKNDNSRSIILKPDSSFKSNMPVIRYK